MSTYSHTRSWIEISSAALRTNYRRIASAIGPDAVMIPAVKADAYGLGVLEVVRCLEPEAPAAWGVATVEEGGFLRAHGVVRPIHLLSPVPVGAEEQAVTDGLTVSISTPDALRRLEEAAVRAGRSADFQVEVDTGMGRSGFAHERVAEWGPAIDTSVTGPLVWKGLYTHFHSAETADVNSVKLQTERFEAVLEALGPFGAGFLIHAANSAAALRFPALVGNAARPGIGLFGGEIGPSVSPPSPVVALRTSVVHTRDAAPGSTAGYGAIHTARRPERWATLGIGYGDGLPRAFAERGEVLIRGVRAPVVGRISMDVTVVDITHVAGVETGAVATVIGSDPDGGGAITLDEVAERSGTISYEILTGLTRRLPRVWVQEEAEQDETG